jgi:ABC-type multidrug transport system fused ATPase/permease subunit
MPQTFQQYQGLLVKYLSPQKRAMAALGALLLGNIALQLANPQIAKRFIDALQTGGERSYLVWSGVAYVVIAIGHQMASGIASVLGANVGWRATNAMRQDLACHCLRLDMSFHKAHTPGEMIERIDGDMTALSDFFAQFTVSVLGSGLLVMGIVALLWLADWRMGLVILVFVILAAFILARAQKLGSRLWQEQRQADAELFGFIEERLAGTEDIRACGAVPYVMRRLYQVMRVATHKTLKAGTVGAGITHNVTDLLGQTVTAAALGMGAVAFLRGEATLGTVYLMYSYCAMLVWPLEEISRRMQDLQKAAAGIQRASQLLRLHSRLAEPTAEGRFTGVLGHPLGVSFEAVSFAYVDQPLSLDAPSPGSATMTGEPALDLVLHGVSFCVQPGHVLGLLGRTGSGKTTIGRLLLRLYDPDRGTVRLGAEEHWVDVRSLATVDLRRQVGVVSQNIDLFHASVRENLSLFDASIPDSEIIAVLEQLGLGPWLALQPDGLDTELSSSGGLSAGEAQLLAFGRIFLQDPGLVILDEASSRLDPATEQLIERAVDRLLTSRTGIVIAHRLNTLDRADEIMILEAGQIAECGERRALAASPGSRFHELLHTGLEEVLA